MSLFLRKIIDNIYGFLWFVHLIENRFDDVDNNMIFYIDWILKGMFMFSYLPLRIISMPLQWISSTISIMLYTYLRENIKWYDKILDNTDIDIKYILMEFNRLCYVGIIISILIYYYEETFVLAFFGLTFKFVLLALVELVKLSKKNNTLVRF